MYRYYVYYRHHNGYQVRRAFRTLAEAREFIDVNAMVCPLPDVKLIATTEA
jgi:hypothetical protein